MAVERIAGTVEGDVVRQRHRQVLLRHRHHAACLAMDDRDRAAPVALARDAPVAQAEVDLALGHRPIAARARFSSRLATSSFASGDRHAVEEARIDHAAVAVIGGVGDDERLRVLARRADHRRVAEAVFVDEVEVALVVRRAAEDRAGAVIHQDEVGDIDRQLPRRIERMHAPGCRCRSPSSRRCRSRPARCRVRLHSAMKAASAGLFAAAAAASGWSGAIAMNFAPNSVSGRVVKISSSLSPLGVVFASSAKRTSRPSRAADPVLLHQPHFFRPALERVERVEQVLRESR